METPAIQTVLGLVNPAELGIVLPAEHLYIQQFHIPGHESSWQLEDDEVLASEIDAFQRHNGTCIVDTTPGCIGRSPVRLKAMSQRAQIHIVMATGWYIGNALPPEDMIERRMVDSLAAQIITEFTEGVDNSGIRPGIIGEFGTCAGWISPVEERIHRASARAHRETGLPLSTHSLHSEIGLAQLDILEEEGVAPSRVAIGHCDSWPMIDYWCKIAERGAYVQLDNIGDSIPRMEDRLARLVVELIERGYEKQILLSHDMGLTSELSAFGGRGLTHIFTSFLPRLQALGIDDAMTATLTSKNPIQYLTLGTH